MAEWPYRSPRRASWSAALTLAGAAFAAAAYAVAPQLVPPEQVAGANPGEGVAVDQLGGQERILVSTPSLPATEPRPQQLSPRVGDPAVTQLHRPEWKAGAIPSPSTTEQSRPEAAEAIGGQDRCDRIEKPTDQPVVCRHTVETRADEFKKPSLEVPLQQTERKLLGGHVLPAAEVVARNASTGEAGGDATVDDGSTQALASIVLAQPAESTTVPDGPPAAEKSENPDPALIGILLPPGARP